MAEPITPKQLGDLKAAVEAAGPISHLALTPDQYTRFAYALAWAMGGSLDTVDAFLTQMPGILPEVTGNELLTEPPQRPIHRVYWLRGNLLGSMAVETPDSLQDETPLLSGYVRSLSEIKRLEIRDVEVIRHDTADEPDIRPEVRLHFNNVVISIDVTVRDRQEARDQARAFIDHLQQMMIAI